MLALPTNLRSRKDWVSHQQHYRTKRVLSLRHSPTSPLPRPSRLHSLSESWCCFRLERYWHLPQGLWRIDRRIHVMKESISCRPSNSVDDRPYTRVNRAATPSAFSFVRSRIRTLLFEGHKKETPGHSRVEVQKRIDHFAVRAAFGVQGSFTAVFPNWWPGLPQQLEQRSNEAPSATIAKLRHKLGAATVRDVGASNGSHYG